MHRSGSRLAGFAAVIICLATCLSLASTQPEAGLGGDSAALPSDVGNPAGRRNSGMQVLFLWGVEGRNRIDTTAGTLTKDLVSDPSITVPFELSHEQLTHVFALADSLGFWRLPDCIAPPDTMPTVGMRHPCGEFLLRLDDGQRAKTVLWDTCKTNPCAEREQIRPLGELLKRMATASEAYRSLPKARGGYM